MKLVRLHVSRMSYRQRRDLLREVRRDDWELTDYCQRRGDERSLIAAEVLALRLDGELVEYSWSPSEGWRRLLMRRDGVCAIIDLECLRVITCWWNDPEDRHATLRVEEYLFGAR